MKDAPATSVRLADAPTSWPRAAALSGIAFAVFLALAWFLNGADDPALHRT